MSPRDTLRPGGSDRAVLQKIIGWGGEPGMKLLSASGIAIGELISGLYIFISFSIVRKTV